MTVRAYEAYKSHSNAPMPRIDLILLAYRKSLEWLQQARDAVAAGKPDVAVPLLTRTQLVITSLAAGCSAAADDVSKNFLRLYEFASTNIARADVADIDAARKVLQTLMEGFQAAREQALALEAQGKLAPLGHDLAVQITV